ncbi:cupin domain-containing protein [Nonomuraea roseoviolacea subsp. roseoviolacea]|uniref:Mannose-6-phosphate isomerase-like protein (Cupin superfamily) n=1 Tax=Nonomuraea roseoviolacea subsp. carminata TaxID=160689 RepID=A0ABT1KBQ8_9ACTN|nr:cupin domain-containing protein [Nonomuraea roseoviolacea]MCP2351386.1 mannose-6-phosphate isomerase-like protein (cupin superfamily) [Nonomuraea roseoviolacea subsp. carminata]
MTYPSPRYYGETGEINAAFRPATATPDLVTGGGAYHYLATTASTDGEFGLYRVDMNGAPGGPSLHFHRTISESFFILSGRMSLFDGERWVEATAGDFLYVPVGGLHAFRNDSGEPASMLMLFAPGAPREGYFEGITELAGLTDEERARFFVEHDSYFTDIATGPQGGFTRRG